MKEVMRIGRPSPGLMARLGVTMGGWVRKLRAVEDQSAPIPRERTSKLGRTIVVARCGLADSLFEQPAGYLSVRSSETVGAGLRRTDEDYVVPFSRGPKVHIIGQAPGHQLA
jgi:hypothetical protein